MDAHVQSKSKMDTIEKIIQMYPELKRDKKSIINNVFGVKKSEYVDECIIDKIIHNDTVYYRDNNDIIVDAMATLVGFCEITTDGYKYYYFEDIKKIKTLNTKIKFIKQ